METKRKPLRISISVGIESAFFLFILLMTLALCGAIFGTLRGILRDELQKQMDVILKIGALTVDASGLGALTDPAQESSEAYLTLKKSLQTIRDQSSGIRFVYTMRRTEAGAPEFVVDAETDPDQMSHIGDLYEAPTPTMFQALGSGQVGTSFIERDPSPDAWGSWLSGYIVLGDGRGKPAGILGIDVSAATIQTNEGRVLGAMLLVAGAVSLLILVIGFLISRRITVPLKAIEADMVRIQRFQIDDTIEINSVFKEIRLMNEAIGDMKTSLRAFKRYVPADLVAQLITLHREARLGGQRKELTVLFSDIENFTTWAESLEPEVLIQRMAQYFSGMTEVILAHRGTVDKYIGDAIMAFWGAPVDLADHPDQACQAALECVRFQHRLNAGWEAEGLPPLVTRFGINTGEVLVGNVGYDERLNYTVMGDPVNLASRLESLNKLYRTKILITEETRSRLEGRFLTRPVDCVVVKGKTEPIFVHELMAGSEVSEKHRDYAEFSAQAFAFYQNRDWKSALGAFEKLLRVRPQDGPAEVLAARCRKYLDEEPGPDWRGAIVLHEK